MTEAAKNSVTAIYLRNRLCGAYIVESTWQSNDKTNVKVSKFCIDAFINYLRRNGCLNNDKENGGWILEHWDGIWFRIKSKKTNKVLYVDSFKEDYAKVKLRKEPYNIQYSLWSLHYLEDFVLIRSVVGYLCIKERLLYNQLIVKPLIPQNMVCLKYYWTWNMNKRIP